MKDGDLKKTLKENLRKPVKELIKERFGQYQGEEPDPNYEDNEMYIRGWEDGFEAGKIKTAMYGEAKQAFPGNEVELQETISKEGSQWIVKSKSGKKLGTHDTKEDATDQLQAIEASKG